MKNKNKNGLALLTFSLAIFNTSVKADGYGDFYFLGDSLTDCCVLGRATQDNTPTWADQLPPLVGASYSPSTSSNYAVAGAQSGAGSIGSPIQNAGLQFQTVSFLNSGTTLNSNDLVGLWIGTNDIWPSAYLPAAIPALNIAAPPIGYQPPADALTNYITGNVRTSIETLRNMGMRNFVLLAPYDLSKSNMGQMLGADAAAMSLASSYSIALRDAYADIYTPGVNTYFFDTLTLLDRIQANPARYGFTHWLSSDSICGGVGIACDGAGLSRSRQEQYLFADSIHLTNSFHTIVARYVANIINARSILPATADIGQSSSKYFADGLMARMLWNSSSVASFDKQNSITPFVEASAGQDNRNAESGSLGGTVGGYKGDVRSLTVGAAYHFNQQWTLGIAGNYQQNQATLKDGLDAKIESDNYQLGLFSSFKQDSIFFDTALSYGTNDYSIDRAGVYDRVTADTKGTSLTAVVSGGYFFDIRHMKVGPIAQLTYGHTKVDAYREQGDSLLTLGVDKQRIESSSGALGIRTAGALSVVGHQVLGSLTLTAEHDFEGTSRDLSSFSTNAPSLIINSGGGYKEDHLYGKLHAGFSMPVDNSIKLGLDASSVFARSYGSGNSITAFMSMSF
ncbi:autotransporter domain-containing protein [Pseudomonas sp. 2FG]|uniref:autotransporter domain-containing protein n=1 Tax=Pseudomonas sp. 2FG TaxID=2502191 RepID=UPI0010F9EAB3|nr:autotransporter domain-containing protein [Pseudomonas sp. 2FG]